MFSTSRQQSNVFQGARCQDPNAAILEALDRIDKADSLYGCQRLLAPEMAEGWLYNVYETTIVGDELLSGVECYFMRDTLDLFKIIMPMEPYFFIRSPAQNYALIQVALMRLHRNCRMTYEVLEKRDLSARNHLAIGTIPLLQITFKTTQEMNTVIASLRKVLFKRASATTDIYASTTVRLAETLEEAERITSAEELVEYIDELLETDIALPVRFLIDTGTTLSTWYSVATRPDPDPPLLTRLDKTLPPTPKVLAYDIETTKKPLCFPSAEEGDQIMCISYMLDDQGYLLVNREIFSEDIADFEYTPRPEYPGRFACFNFASERAVLRFFFDHICLARPNVFSTFNGDFFDWGFVEKRAEFHGFNLFEEIGFYCIESTSRDGIREKQYVSRAIPHLDCFRWVRRDSYLPQGSQGLKAVTRAKLKYHPDELSPELMTPYARTHPQTLASYSVSDAVATYYLYKKYVHPFIFALGTIIPLNPDDILRRGTGTLCEHLLMVHAYQANVPFPNKYSEPPLQVVTDSEGARRILVTQTYVGGKVEAVNAGVYRHDITYDFEYYSAPFRDSRWEGYYGLIEHLDRDLLCALGKDLTTIETIKAIYSAIHTRLNALSSVLKTTSTQGTIQHQAIIVYSPQKNAPCLSYELLGIGAKPQDVNLIAELTGQLRYALDTLLIEVESSHFQDYSRVRKNVFDALWSMPFKSVTCPLLYHLDVAAMYPNIMLTNRLQPPAIAQKERCAACDYNTANDAEICKRVMFWDWRGAYYPLDYSEYLMVKNQTIADKGSSAWGKLSERDRANLLHSRLDLYSRTQYHMKRKTEELRRKTVVCQRENGFFIDTVRSFRDRRYEFKGTQKKYTKLLGEAETLLAELLASGTQSAQISKVRQDIEMYRGQVVLAESLQLAHKCILNSFYGYAMRKGSRWYSLEMAAAVTHTGANIIKDAKELIERVGFVLELDTDGVWCCLPKGFPEQLVFHTLTGANVGVNYPGAMLNAMTRERYANQQYLEPVLGQTSTWRRRNECSIEFEVDGPYSCMVLSAAKEEGVRIKKKYAVFDLDGRLAELKGFELKRRGELQIVKSWQSRIFERFLFGRTLEEAYAHAAEVTNSYLDVIYRRGVFLTDSQLLQLIAEASTLRCALDTLPKNRKSATITCVRRLAAFLDPTFASLPGLNVEYVISRYPEGQPVSERAIPIQIFSSPEHVRHRFFRLWTGENVLNLREILDWDYYAERFSGTVYKILVIPSGLQGLKSSPVSRIPFPSWLCKDVAKTNSMTSVLERWLGTVAHKVDASSSSDEEVQEEPPLHREDTVIAPEGSDEPSTWLERQIAYWTHLVERGIVSHPYNETHSDVSDGVLGQLRRHAGDRLLANPLHDLTLTILDVQPLPGAVKANCLCLNRNNVIRRYVISTPGRFYLNSRRVIDQPIIATLATEGLHLRLLDKEKVILPRMATREYVYCCELSADALVAGYGLVEELRRADSVLGIYEHSLPALFQLLMTLTGTFTLTNNDTVRTRLRMGEVSLADIDSQWREQYDSSLFSSDGSRVPISFCTIGTNGVAALFSTGDVHAFVLNDEEAIPNMQRTLAEMMSLHSGLCGRLEHAFRELEAGAISTVSSIEKALNEMVRAADDHGVTGLFFWLLTSGLNNVEHRFLQSNVHSIFVTRGVEKPIRYEELPAFVAEVMVAEVAARALNVPLSLVLNPSYLSSIIYTVPTPSETLLWDVLLARECASNRFLLWHGLDRPLTEKVQAHMLSTYQIDTPGAYHGYVLVLSLGSLLPQLILNFLQRSSTIGGGELAMITGQQLRTFGRVMRHTLQVTPPTIRRRLGDAVGTYLTNKHALLYDLGMVRALEAELAAFLGAVRSVLLSHGFTMIHASATTLTIASEKLKEDLLENSYNSLIQALKESGFCSNLNFPALTDKTRVLSYRHVYYDSSTNYFGLSGGIVRYRCSLAQVLPAFAGDMFKRAMELLILHISENLSSEHRSLTSARDDLDRLTGEFASALRQRIVEDAPVAGLEDIHCLFYLQQLSWPPNTIKEHAELTDVSPSLCFLRSLAHFIGLGEYGVDAVRGFLLSSAGALSVASPLDRRLEYKPCIPPDDPTEPDAEERLYTEIQDLVGSYFLQAHKCRCGPVSRPVAEHCPTCREKHALSLSLDQLRQKLRHLQSRGRSFPRIIETCEHWLVKLDKK
ncbi:DNA polymerase epsilon, catalytic subunit [Giardia muris]|uniref:DNA polymerase epsilon catalytic subunit n=1 Tax=Giardia muris TaxID=5742 RepID=A0A4Z1SZN0_GIAMU|nr:DNA polymerase epsilon, catalytic subunit [Giardia muris]|eukprot:TNJ30205.1 DNA polymerase epsilon, catalytic subunit [Giardia muris]